MRLADVPTGQTIFVDSNCFLYHYTGVLPTCTAFFQRTRRRELQAVTSTIVLTEVHHRLMVLEAVQRVGRPLRNGASFLRAHPELIRSAHLCERALSSVRASRVRVLPLTASLVKEARRLSHELGLLTNDALIVATMRAHRLVHLASNDTDFAPIPGITLWRP